MIWSCLDYLFWHRFFSLVRYLQTLEKNKKILTRSTLVKEMLPIFLGEFAIISQLNLPTKLPGLFFGPNSTPWNTQKNGNTPFPTTGFFGELTRLLHWHLNTQVLHQILDFWRTWKDMPCHGGSWYQINHFETALAGAWGWHSLWLLRCNFVDVDC